MRSLYAECLLVLWALQAVSVTSLLSSVGQYEVIRPKRLHNRQRRDTEALYPAEVQYAMTLGGREIVINLHRSRRLVSDDYTETYYLENGTEVSHAPSHKDHCYYHGHINGSDQPSASFSTCDGLSGYVQSEGQSYVMEPLGAWDEGDHAVYKSQALALPLRTCGVNTTAPDLGPRIEEIFASDTQRSHYLNEGKYVEAYVVADFSEFKRIGSVEKVRKRVFQAINHVNLLYKPLNTHVALIGLEVWSAGDKISVNRDSGKLLNSIMAWRETHLLPNKKHDNLQFITNLDFIGDTIGLAYVTAMCTKNSGAVNQDHADSVFGVASTIAHEMGHNLGMSHDKDTCYCQDAACIMAPSISSRYPEVFSACSHRHYQNFVLSRGSACIRNTPNLLDVVATPVCGNHFVERGEECDCGTPEECTNRCCNAHTCKLHSHADCAEGDCCHDCRFSKAGSVCRPVKHECDLAEMCDGRSSRCAADAYRMNGTPCQNNSSFCNNGQCPQTRDQCVTLWGPGARPAPDSCYNHNKRGDVYGHCRKIPPNTYQPCAHRDIKCGLLSCRDGGTQPTFATKYASIGSCKLIVDSQNGDSHPGLVQNGIKCGESKMCMDGQCQLMMISKALSDCTAKCPQHATCNHLEQCQCEEGWAPPHCQSAFSSFSTYLIVALVLVAVVVIAAVIGSVLYRRHKRSKSSRPEATQNIGVTNPAFTAGTPQLPRAHNAYPIQVPRTAPPPPPTKAFKPYPNVPPYQHQMPPQMPMPYLKPYQHQTPPKMPPQMPPQIPKPKVLMPRNKQLH